MPHLQTNGINLYYEEHGSGEPLLLIMGFTVSSIGWHWNIPAFARDFRTIAFDNRGVGQSDKPDAPYSMVMFADDTAGVLDGLGIDQAHVFGISMGGMIAQEFALRYPQRVKTLIVGCTHCGGSQAVLSKDPDVLNLLADIESVDVQQAAVVMTKVAVTPWFMQKHMDVLLQLNQLSLQHPTPQHGMVCQMQAIQGHDTYERLPQVSVPTLVITGKEDGLVPPENSVTLAQRIPNADLAILANGSHLFNIELPETTAETVKGFIRRRREWM
ncbi:MAG TPA: alpha/beta fold hydrolase [Candidatus Binatia bacterium]|jgi:pimeloyl-ACP methyl ester carboxylesterase|nr:alpha/beta fold hydrolase [Candidatus Binatia bacterium]